MNTLQKIFALCCLSLIMVACSDNSSNTIPNIDNSVGKITFLELGAESCKPCIEMRPVMDSIQKKYGDQINVVFIDVYKHYSYVEKYQVKAMPTQVFLDSNEVEIHRHVGFYPEDSIHSFLNSQGLIKLY